MKIGLVMEGGAMRGMYTCGIIDVLMENGITVDGAIGVSAGATFGCNFASRQPGRALRYNLRFAHDPRYCSILSLLLTGDLYGAKFDYDTLPRRLDLFDTFTFRTNPMHFYCLATDAQTGEPVVKELTTLGYEDMDWMRASASMPVASKTVVIDGKGYLDGGCSDSIPLKRFEDMGYEKNIVILTQPEGYVKQPQKAMPLLKVLLRNELGVVSALEKRHESYNDEIRYIAEREKAGSALVFRPPAGMPINHVSHSRKDLQMVYDAGRADGERRLAEVQKFLSEV